MVLCAFVPIKHSVSFIAARETAAWIRSTGRIAVRSPSGISSVVGNVAVHQTVVQGFDCQRSGPWNLHRISGPVSNGPSEL